MNRMNKLKKYKLTQKGKITLIAICAVLLVSLVPIINDLRTEAEPGPDPTHSPTTEPTASAEATARPTQKTTPAPTPTPEETEIPTPTPDASVPVADEYIFNTDYERKPYTVGNPDNTTDFVSGWTVAYSDGFGYGDLSWNRMGAIVEKGGSGIQSVRITRGGIPFNANSNVSITFSLSSDVNRNVQMAVIDGNTNAVLASGSMNASYEPHDHELTFKTSRYTNNAYVDFYIGNDGSGTTAEYHTVSVENFRIVSSNPVVSGISIDQVGYQTVGQKRCTFAYDAGDMFDVVDTQGWPVYTGAIIGKRNDDYTGEYDSYGDFTPVSDSNTYYIRSQIGTVSNAFQVEDDPYTEMRDSLLRMLSMQRCSMDLDEWWAGGMSHLACHNYNAIVHGTDVYMDVTGGWHDAGDYGKYVKTGAKAAADLLMAYLYNPDAWTDTISIPASMNGTADILDEVRYELDWMLKMQNSDGGVFNTVIPQNMSDIELPEHDDQYLYVLTLETTSTADFAGTMALASIVFEDVDPAYARKCLTAAKRADEWLEDNPELIDLVNPEGVNGGSYLDSTDNDGRFFTKTALWAATFEDEYLEQAKALFEEDPTCATGLSWNANGGYGRYLFLTAKDSDRIDPDFFKAMKKSLKTEADGLLGVMNGNGYLCSLDSYGWGSNSEALNNGVIMSMAYDFTGNQKYQQAAAEQVHYVLGRNSLNICFVTGFGSNTPSDVHSRVAKAKNTSLPGALVGGPDSYRDDKLTQALPDNMPPAKMYIDSFDSWSTNEVAVYYNSALIHMLGRIKD